MSIDEVKMPSRSPKRAAAPQIHKRLFRHGCSAAGGTHPCIMTIRDVEKEEVVSLE